MRQAAFGSSSTPALVAVLEVAGDHLPLHPQRMEFSVGTGSLGCGNNVSLQQRRPRRRLKGLVRLDS